MAEQIKPGNLVKVMQAHLGGPSGRVGLVVGEQVCSVGEYPYVIYDVLLLDQKRQNRFLGEDLELLNESR